MSRRPIVAGIRSREGGSDPEGGLSRDQLRDAYARWATGVAVVAVRDDEDVLAITVTAFTPVSLDPPLVLVCIHENAGILPSLLEGGRFTISLLNELQKAVAIRLADPFPAGSDLFTATPDPVVGGAMLGLVCSLFESHAGGDHRIVVGRLERLVEGEEAPPLLYRNRDYRPSR